MELARDHSPAFLFNHVMRSFAFGRAAGEQQGARFDPEMLFLGSVLHDLGLTEKFIAGIGREREHLPIPGFCDIVMHAQFDE